VFTTITVVARTFGYYTGFVESIAMENVHKYVGSSWIVIQGTI